MEEIFFNLKDGLNIGELQLIITTILTIALILLNIFIASNQRYLQKKDQKIALLDRKNELLNLLKDIMRPMKLYKSEYFFKSLMANGQKMDKYSFFKSAILNNSNEIKKMIDEENKYVSINLSKLSGAQQKTVESKINEIRINIIRTGMDFVLSNVIKFNDAEFLFNEDIYRIIINFSNKYEAFATSCIINNLSKIKNEEKEFLEQVSIIEDNDIINKIKDNIRVIKNKKKTR